MQHLPKENIRIELTQFRMFSLYLRRDTTCFSLQCSPTAIKGMAVKIMTKPAKSKEVNRTWSSKVEIITEVTGSAADRMLPARPPTMLTPAW